MRHNDTSVVIILNPVEELHSVGRTKVLLRGIKDLVIWESSLIGGGNLADIGLQSNNHRLVSNTKTVHLMGSHAHDKSLTCSYFMIAYATAILNNHRDTVLLTLINILNIELRSGKGFEVDAGEGLVVTVILSLDETVELAVIHLLKLITLLLGEVSKIFSKAITDFLNL